MLYLFHCHQSIHKEKVVMWKTYSGEILFPVGSHVFAKAAKSLKAGEESVFYDEARIERDLFFEVKQFLSEQTLFKQSRSLQSQKFT